MKYTIEVTENDIKNGKAGDATQRPVATAIKRHTGIRNVVAWTSICINSRKAIKTPRALHEWMHDFDRRKPVEPICFELEIP